MKLGYLKPFIKYLYLEGCALDTFILITCLSTTYIYIDYDFILTLHFNVKTISKTGIQPGVRDQHNLGSHLS